MLKNKWGSEVVQAKGKGVFENGKVGNSRDFQQKPSRPSITVMTSSQPRSVIASSKLNRHANNSE